MPPGVVARYASDSDTPAQWLTNTATAKQLPIVSAMNPSVSGISRTKRRSTSTAKPPPACHPITT